MRGRVVVLVAAAMVGAVLLRPSSGSAASSDADQRRVATSVERTLDQKTAKVDADVEVIWPAVTLTYRLYGGAALDRSAATLIADLGAQLSDYPALIPVRVADDDVYVDIGRLLDSNFGPAPLDLAEVEWVQFDPTAAPELGALPVGAGLTADAFLALGVLRSLDPATIRERGSTRIRERRVTHYVGTVDLTDADTLAGVPSRALARMLLGAPGFTRGDSLEVEVWIRRDGLIARFEQHLVVRAGTGLQTESSTRVDLFDFGTDLQIEAPPAEETITFERFTELVNLPDPV